MRGGIVIKRGIMFEGEDRGVDYKFGYGCVWNVFVIDKLRDYLGGWIFKFRV